MKNLLTAPSPLSTRLPASPPEAWDRTAACCCLSGGPFRSCRRTPQLFGLRCDASTVPIMKIATLSPVSRAAASAWKWHQQRLHSPVGIHGTRQEGRHRPEVVADRGMSSKASILCMTRLSNITAVLQHQTGHSPATPNRLISAASPVCGHGTATQHAAGGWKVSCVLELV